MDDNSQNEHESTFGRFALPGRVRNSAKRGQSEAETGLPNAGSAQAPSLPPTDKPTASQKQGKNLQHFFIAPQKKPFFVHRDKPHANYLQRLADDVEVNRLQILYGPMGCGKTALALQYAYQNFQGHQGESPDKRYASVFWLDATTKSVEETIRQTFKEKMELQQGQSWLKDFTEKIRAYEADLDENDRWLLVIDGYDEHQHDQDYLELPIQFHEQTQRGHIILTMRNAPNGTQYTAYMLRRIENMLHEVEEARDLLLCAYFNRHISDIRDKLGYPGSAMLQDEAEMQAAAKLVAELWYNPHLICSAGRYMYANYKMPSHLIPFLHGEAMQVPFNELAANEDPLSKIYAELVEAWSQNYTTIQDFPASYEILMLCAFLNRGRLPRLLIDSRPERDSVSSLYNGYITQPDNHLRPLRGLGFLSHDHEDGTFLYLDMFIRDMVHRHFQPRPFDNRERRKALENGLRQHQVYVIHTVSTVFLGLEGVSAEYASYASHIIKCIEYLENEEIRKYIQQKKPFMLDNILRFLATVGCYLRQHPENEGIHHIAEISDANEKKISLNAVHLFDLALKIYNLWSPDEQALPERKQILYPMLPSLHEHLLYQRGRTGLNEIKNYYPEIKEFDADAEDSAISVHHDLGYLKSDLHDYAGAEEQFKEMLNKLERYLPTADERQKPVLACWKAEILMSKAANLLRQASQCQDWNLYTRASDAYWKTKTTLERLKSSTNISTEIQQRIEYLKERCHMDRVVLLLVTSPEIYKVPLIEDIEQYRTIIDQKIRTFGYSKDVPYHTYLQMVVDLNNLAEAYRRLGQQNEQKGVSLRVKEKPYFKLSKEYSIYALTCYDYFYRVYPKKHPQVQVILQTVWANYQENPLYDVSKGETRTKELWNLQEKLI